MNKFILVGLLVVLSGCGTRGYLSHDMNPEKFYQDYYMCENQPLDFNTCMGNQGYWISDYGDKNAYRTASKAQRDFAKGFKQGLINRRNNTIYLDVKHR